MQLAYTTLCVREVRLQSTSLSLTFPPRTHSFLLSLLCTKTEKYVRRPFCSRFLVGELLGGGGGKGEKFAWGWGWAVNFDRFLDRAGGFENSLINTIRRHWRKREPAFCVSCAVSDLMSILMGLRCFFDTQTSREQYNFHGLAERKGASREIWKLLQSFFSWSQ